MRAGVYSRQSKGKAKSIDEQLDAGHLTITEHGWTHAGSYSDKVSASRYGTKVRGGWAQVLSDVEARLLDVLILWESSRGDRTPETWFAFLSTCRATGTRVHVISHERTYDLKNARDWKVLAEDGVSNAYEVELLSVRTRRGHAGAAKDGLPPGGPVPYGYRRVFDESTGKRVGWVPNEPQASTVREIYARVGKGEPLTRIASEVGLTANAVRRIARSPLYIGVRTHQGIEHKGTWDALVTPAAFQAAQRVLSEPGRRITRPGRQKWLLSYLGACDVCSAPLEQAVGYYRCSSVRKCVSAPRDDVDAALTEWMLARLSEPDALLAMAARDDTEAAAYEAEAERLQRQLGEWEQIAKKGGDSPARVYGIMQGLEAGIADAKAKARAASLPPVLREWLDSDIHVSERWKSATVVVRRQVIKALAEVRIGRGIPGRTPDILRRERAFHRLAPSRWIGDDRTWGELLA